MSQWLLILDHIDLIQSKNEVVTQLISSGCIDGKVNDLPPDATLQAYSRNSEHFDYPFEDWLYLAAQGDTEMSYDQWVFAKLDEETHN
jgi:hypothetical protein